MFKIFRFNCCGLDVHKTWIFACIGITDTNFRTEYFEARFSSFPKDLRRLSALCETADVSRSGYYSYLESEDLRQQREQHDREEFLKILEAYKFRGYSKGARGIYMRLIHLKPPVVMNLKKIRRLMKKYNLRCPIRKPNPYRQIARDMRTDYVAPNLVNLIFQSFSD